MGAPPAIRERKGLFPNILIANDDRLATLKRRTLVSIYFLISKNGAASRPSPVKSHGQASRPGWGCPQCVYPLLRGRWWRT